MKYLLILLFAFTANAKIECKKATHEIPEFKTSMDYVSIQLNGEEIEYVTPKKDSELDKKYKHCKVLAVYFTCKLRKVTIDAHYRVINYFTGMEILVPEHTENRWLFNKVLYKDKDDCEAKVIRTIEEILSND